MGCNKCRRAKEKEAQNSRTGKLKRGEIEAVKLNTLKTRRDACRKCPYSSKNPHPKYSAFGGLTFQSLCKKTKQSLKVCLTDPQYQCPDKRF